MQNDKIDPMMSAHRKKFMRQSSYILWATMGFIYPATLVAVLWNINTTGGRVVNFLSHEAWIPVDLNEEKMVFLPMYALAIGCSIAAFIAPNLIGKSAFVKWLLRMAFLNMAVNLGASVAAVLNQAELIIPFVILGVAAAAMSSPEKFFENN